MRNHGERGVGLQMAWNAPELARRLRFAPKEHFWVTAAERHWLRSTISSTHEVVKTLPEIRQPYPKTRELPDLEEQGEMVGGSVFLGVIHAP